ncbi:DsbA family protein [Mycolicibacterium sp.]|uniref:DsbA family protein n=1 Tax=Mycolicibacterium sp. TaxID=2320850 RepID=UPI00355FC40E
MRGWRAVLAAVTAALLVSGCTVEVAGTARPDLRGPGVALTADGAGIQVGFPDAPVQLELFTEPQCQACAYLQSDFGDELRSHLDSGRLAVTYRPVTFLDDALGLDYSATVTNALFTAVDPATSAGGFQAFVQELWAHQDLSETDFGDADFAAIAAYSGLLTRLVESIGQGVTVVDADAVSEANAELLEEILGRVATPVVFDLDAEEILDIDDVDWLSDLMRTA